MPITFEAEVGWRRSHGQSGPKFDGGSIGAVFRGAGKGLCDVAVNVRMFRPLSCTGIGGLEEDDDW